MKTINANYILPAATVIAIGVATGCVAFNEECSRFMEDPDGVAAYLESSIKIQRSDVRMKDNALGQAVAEAFYHAFDGSRNDDDLPQVAIVNGGSIREDGLCEERPTLDKGPLYRKVLRDILPYDNTVVLTKVSNRQLKQIFEHSIAIYKPASPQGAYLQLYGAIVEADCSKPAEVIDAGTEQIATPGSRITSIRLMERGCDADDENCYGMPLDLTRDDQMVRVVLDSFLFGGGDGFPRLTNEVASAGAFNFDVAADYLSRTYTEENPLKGTPVDLFRLSNCKNEE